MNERHSNSGHNHGTHSRSDAHSRHSSQSKGRYLKQSSSRRRRHRHHRRRINPLFVSVIILALLLVIGLGICLRSCGGPSIKGRWDLDGTTVYRFDGDGKGALVLMYAEYEFNYTIEGDQLYIDFVDEGALDASYTFMVERRMLFMTGGPGDAKTEFVLTRML